MFKVQATDASGKVTGELQIGIPQILEGIYGRIEMNTRNVALLIATMLTIGVGLGFAGAYVAYGPGDPVKVKMLLLTPFYLIGWYAALTAANRHAMDTLRSGMGNKAWIVPAAYFLASMTMAFGAAALTMEVGGIGGFLLGLAFAAFNPLGRVVAETGFLIRIMWFRLTGWNRNRKALAEQKAAD